MLIRLSSPCPLSQRYEVLKDSLISRCLVGADCYENFFIDSDAVVIGINRLLGNKCGTDESLRFGESLRLDEPPKQVRI